jgi:hypothetical protein
MVGAPDAALRVHLLGTRSRNTRGITHTLPLLRAYAMHPRRVATKVPAPRLADGSWHSRIPQAATARPQKDRLAVR